MKNTDNGENKKVACKENYKKEYFGSQVEDNSRKCMADNKTNDGSEEAIIHTIQKHVRQRHSSQTTIHEMHNDYKCSETEDVQAT